MERLDKIIATGGGISRSDARRMIYKGQVAVDGNTIRDIAFKVDPLGSNITLDGRDISYKKYIYLVMNKPEGVLTATEDKKQQTVIDLIPVELKRRDLFPVGRLDRNTTGMLIITNDGDFGHMLLSPVKKIPKRYYVELDGDISEEMPSRFSEGLTLVDGTKLSSALLEIGVSKDKCFVTITEGKYHQIKRMFGLFGLGVNKLKRTSFAGLELPKELKPGEVRELTSDELECIFNAKNAVK